MKHFFEICIFSACHQFHKSLKRYDCALTEKLFILMVMKLELPKTGVLGVWKNLKLQALMY